VCKISSRSQVHEDIIVAKLKINFPKTKNGLSAPHKASHYHISVINLNELLKKRMLIKTGISFVIYDTLSPGIYLMDCY